MMNYQMSNNFTPYPNYYNMPTSALNAPNLNFNEQRVELTRVNGIEGAKTYSMNPNSTVALFDANDDLMYIKQSDGAGFSNIRKFSFSEISETNESVSEDWVSRNEFEQFKKEVMDIGKQFIRFTKQDNYTTEQSADK